MAAEKVAIVTGSNKGIGFAIVRALCSKFDGDVFLTSRNDERGQEAVKQIEKEGLKVKYHQLDITDTESIKRMKEYMMQHYRGVDVLVNNAGIAFKCADTTPFAIQARASIDNNYFGTLQVSKSLLPCIKPNGRVVNISSFKGLSCLYKSKPEFQKVFHSITTEEELSDQMNEFVAATERGTHIEEGWPNTAYGVSVLGVSILSRIHARWLREQGKNDILLNACSPGWVRTDMAGSKGTKSPDEGAHTPAFLALLPVGATEPHGQFLTENL